MGERAGRREGKSEASEEEREKEDAILLRRGQVLWPAGRLVESSCRRFLVSASFNVPAVRVSANACVLRTCVSCAYACRWTWMKAVRRERRGGGTEKPFAHLLHARLTLAKTFH